MDRMLQYHPSAVSTIYTITPGSGWRFPAKQRDDRPAQSASILDRSPRHVLVRFRLLNALSERDGPDLILYF